MTSNYSAVFLSSLTETQSLLQNFLHQPQTQDNLLLAFGDDFNTAIGVALIQSLATDDITSLVNLEIRPSASINNASGAYSATNNTIYLSTELLEDGNIETITRVFLEEIGHFLDAQGNTRDASGDEGVIFASLVLGETLDSNQLALLQTENDTATVTIDGEVLDIEQMRIIYVNDDATGANNGSSWANAYERLQDALAVAQPGDEIWVADGTYYPTVGADRSASFVIPNEVKIYGGFAGGESSLSSRNIEQNETVLSGDISTPENIADNSYHVVTLNNVSNNTILDGFTITGGNANGSFNDSGGGIFAVDSSATLTHLIIRENNARLGDGGGMYSRNSVHLLSNIQFLSNAVSVGDGGGLYTEGSTDSLENVTFVNNFASSSGGGISNRNGSLELHDVELIGNRSNDGGGIFNNSSLELNDVKFIANQASNNGGGIYNFSASGFTVSDGIFLNNSARNGGGINNFSSDFNAEFDISRAIFKGNVADVGGGIYYNSQGGTFSNILSNSIFEENYSRLGAGIHNTNSSPRIVNSTVVGNLSLFGGAIGNRNTNSSQTTIINSILWDNSGIFSQNPNTNSNSVTDISFSLIEGGASGEGNINTDPLFVNPDNFDYRLSASSPAINSGTNDVVNTNDSIEDFDLAGNPRIANGTIDMGAYEGAELAPVPTEPQVLEDSTIVYVDRDATGDNNGSSWTNAYTSLQEALRRAPLGSQIWVAEGTYLPSEDNRTVSFQLRNTIALYGGFAGNESQLSQRNWETNPTILSGEIGDSLEISDNIYHVVNASNVTTSAVLDGFTISGGNANNSRDNNDQGGGILSIASQATLKNLRLEKNNARFGGGIYIENNSSHLLTSVTFANNNASSEGGAVYNKSTSFFFDNKFINNSSNEDGGAIYNRTTNIYLERATFDSNRANNAGGAIYFNDNTFSLNTADTGEKIVNSVFKNNQSSFGGAIYNRFSDAEGINLTFANNTADNGAAIYSQGQEDSINPKYYNSIFWNNQGKENTAQIFNDGENTIVSNSIVQGGFSGQNNLDIDPQFANLEAGDLRITSDSPAIDAGINDFVTRDEDLAGLPRIFNGTVDIGAYEYVEPLLTINNPVINLGDTEAVFTVSLINSSGETVNSDESITVDYTTIDGTATTEEDYIATSGTLTFAPGETEKTINVAVNSDAVIEESENFFVELTNPSDDIRFENNRAIATIEEEDNIQPLELYRFRNTSFSTGTYVFVGALERDAILNDPNLNQTFVLEGGGNPAFIASSTDAEGLIPFFRLKSIDVSGTFLFVSTPEYDAIFAEDSDQKNKWEKEGFDTEGNDIPEFYLYPPSSGLGLPFNRYQNRSNGTFLYAGSEESDAIDSNPDFSNAFLKQGGAFESLT